jgi:quercetin dioxygenase-like cupin family protein
MHVARAKDVNLKPEVREIFTGDVSTSMLAGADVGERLRLNLVRFAPGARTKWHRHSFEQGLLITEGKGIVATEEHEHVVEAGDAVVVLAQEKHWHGATASTAMTHVSISQIGETEVLEAVDHIRTPDA